MKTHDTALRICFVKILFIDHIEYDVIVQISALQDGVCARVRVCVRACAVEIKPAMLRAACFIDVHVWMRVQFDLQDGDFHSKKKTVYSYFHLSLLLVIGCYWWFEFIKALRKKKLSIYSFK